jgi:O-antigen ligase
VFGVGYESFWLGSRLQKIWDTIHGLRLNESHNGYIEVVITLGWIGTVLLGGLIAIGYRNYHRLNGGGVQDDGASMDRVSAGDHRCSGVCRI